MTAPAVARLPLLAIELPLAMLIVIVVRMIRPFCLVRFQRLIGWRIGHFAGNVEMYLCERDAGINMPKGHFIDIWYHLTPVYNRQLDAMWRRVIHVGPPTLTRLVAGLNSLIPGGQVHVIGDNTQADRDVHHLFDRIPAHLTFTPEEESRGQAGLRDLGVPTGAPFVCLIVRDPAFLQAQSADANQKVNWSRHSFRDCTIGNYVRAARALAERGYYVLRMGALVSEAMDVSHPRIIDYAVSGKRSDFMDIYLGAYCAFCISNGLGFDCVPYAFRRPIVLVDHVPIGLFYTFGSRYLSTTKKHWKQSLGRFMTLREIVESGAAHFYTSDEYEQQGISLRESSPAEIEAVVLEMEERLKGTWRSDLEDERLQRKFWGIFPKTERHGEFRARVGARFLRDNPDWLA